jgi:LysM repeat protein
MHKAGGRLVAFAVGLLFSLVSVSAVPTHTVRPGDTLSEVAELYGLTVQVLVDANGIADPNFIRAGDVLKIPGESGEPQPAHTYVVEEGDTLSHIAVRFDTTVDAIKKANGLESDLIVIGRSLSIPGAAPPVTASPPPVVEVPELEIPVVRPYDPALEAIFDELAAAEGVDAGTVKAIAWLESGWDQGARSPSGATGVMQIMPGTVAWLETRVFGQDLNEEGSAYDNVKAGVRYLRLMQDQTGSPQMAVVAYYQGPGVTAHGILYQETQRYVDAVNATRARFWP